MKDKDKLASKSGGEPAFIRPLEGDGEQVQVSFRIGVLEKARFEAAQATLRNHGKDMQIADVLRTALRDAANYVEQRYPKGRGEAGIRDDEQLRKPSYGATRNSVEDSSRNTVEESGSWRVFDGQSKTLQDPPLTGSMATGKEPSGVGATAEENRDGAV